MSDGYDSPDWSLLPHNPRAFFGLGGEFDSKDLKRSYNRLLRQFKPEKFPAEFQRIRAAYEHLDNELRYGRELPSPGMGQIRYEWRTDDDGSAREAPRPPPLGQFHGAPASQDEIIVQSPAKPAQRTVPIHERIQREPLSEVYRELVAKDDKSAYEFFALAVMSDVLERKDGLQLVRWLLAGLKAHPSDLGLLSLLYEYYRSPVPGAAVANLLIATSKAVPNERFFSLTEPLWKQLLRERPFHEFRSILENCESNLRDLSIDGRIVFLMAILKPAMWRADPQWVGEMMDFIESNFERIPGRWQFEVDILELLRKYALARRRFLNGHPLREQIDRAICDYFTADQTVADQSVLACEIQIAHDPAGLLSAFAMDSGEDYENLYILWISIVADVYDRNIDRPPDEPTGTLWSSRVQALLNRIENVTRASRFAQAARFDIATKRLGIGCLYFFAVSFVCIVLTMFTLKLSTEVAGLVIVGTIIAGALVCGRIHMRYFRPKLTRFWAKKEAQFYQRLWRPEFAEFLQRSQLDYFELKRLLFQCNIAGLSTANRAIGFYQRDYALPIFTGAQRCLA